MESVKTLQATAVALIFRDHDRKVTCIMHAARPALYLNQSTNVWHNAHDEIRLGNEGGFSVTCACCGVIGNT